MTYRELADSLLNESMRRLAGTIGKDGTVAINVSEMRRNSVRDFYGRTIGKFDVPKDKILFIQCVAALDEQEELDMYDMYIEDFNTALNQYREAKNVRRTNR